MREFSVTKVDKGNYYQLTITNHIEYKSLLSSVKVGKDISKDGEVHKSTLSWNGCQYKNEVEAGMFAKSLNTMHGMLLEIDELIKTAEDFEDLEIHLSDGVIRPHKAITDGVVLLCPIDTLVIGDLKVVKD